jgi:hypothetical protein
MSWPEMMIMQSLLSCDMQWRDPIACAGVCAWQLRFMQLSCSPDQPTRTFLVTCRHLQRLHSCVTANDVEQTDDCSMADASMLDLDVCCVFQVISKAAATVMKSTANSLISLDLTTVVL